METASVGTVPIDTIGTWWLWLAFFGVVLGMLAIDLLAMKGGRSRRVSLREAATWSAVWVMVALLFGAGLWWHLDVSAGRVIANARGLEFLTGYLIEKSLAVDNVFVWLMIFGYFAVPLELQRRVLQYGVLGAIVLRAIMVFLGAWLIAQFHWVLYLFGTFLVFTGIKMLWFAEHQPDLEKNPAARWVRSHYPITPTLEGERFLVVRDGVRYLTPLALVLVLVEISDVIFAVDSIPAIFAVTTDPFIVLTSNIFAIMGLRAMYFLLAGVADRFVLLKYGLGLILLFIGIKMLIVDLYEIPVLVSLLVVAAILVLSMVASLFYTRRRESSTPKSV